VLDRVRCAAAGLSDSLVTAMGNEASELLETHTSRGTAPFADPGAHPQIRRVRVLLVDDHKIVREGLAGLLEMERDIEVIGQASDGQMAIELVRQLRPDVVSMDITMPRMNGIEATRQITAEFPNVRVVGLSMHESSDMARAMQQAGAATYVSKDAPSEELLRAIRGSA
jgi:DNA-binding NarL/FixJ family response regulator